MFLRSVFFFTLIEQDQLRCHSSAPDLIYKHDPLITLLVRLRRHGGMAQSSLQIEGARANVESSEVIPNHPDKYRGPHELKEVFIHIFHHLPNLNFWRVTSFPVNQNVRAFGNHPHKYRRPH